WCRSRPGCVPTPARPGLPCRRFFFDAGGAGVGADDGGVKDEPLQVVVLQRGKDLLPDALLGPAIEAPPLAVPLAQTLGQVTPGGAGLGDPQDGVEELAVVTGDLAMLAGPTRQQVLDTFPVGVRDRVAVAHVLPSVGEFRAPSLPESPICCPHG